MKFLNLFSLFVAFFSISVLSYGQDLTADQVGPSADSDLLSLNSGLVTINGDLTLASDMRLKANIISLGSTLTKLLNIDGKSYTFTNTGDKSVGVLAQDIQKQFPDLVKERQDGMLTVNYQGLIPVVINAIKEQNIELEKAKKANLKLEERIAQLEAIIIK